MDREISEFAFLRTNQQTLACAARITKRTIPYTLRRLYKEACVLYTVV